MNKATRAAATVLLACALALPAATLPASATTIAPPVPSVAAALRAPAPAALPTTSAPLELPAPTGRFAVGAGDLHLVDHSRPDPWVPTADGRELMVTLHYPAARRTGGTPAPYATEDESRLLLAGVGGVDPAGIRDLAAMNTYSVKDARPAPGRRPLVVLSPGFGMPRFTLTALAVDLASRGYVVASVDHAYETSGTSVPGGRVLAPCVACELLATGRIEGADVTAARAADVRFLLDRLTGPHAVQPYARMIDRDRIGMAGHSIGGASAEAAMLKDRRIDAGANMDGSFWDALPAGGLGGRPFLFLGADDAHFPGGGDTSWDTTWRALGGRKYWLTVAGADHMTFTDAPVLLRHFGVPSDAVIPDGRALAVTRAYVAAFFDRELRGTPQPLLDGPSPLHPEVRFHTP
ncbi:alpha/beta hydrolase [Streptomyces sp. NPDC048717]|uniref:alpha/beta hydrolase family protein n=1 Tax=Streptomyces sp. NPDC048717 TaxID=3154928 RepID=UPI003413860A